MGWGWSDGMRVGFELESAHLCSSFQGNHPNCQVLQHFVQEGNSNGVSDVEDIDVNVLEV